MKNIAMREIAAKLAMSSPIAKPCLRRAIATSASAPAPKPSTNRVMVPSNKSTARTVGLLRRERNGARSTERLSESSEHYEVGVERDPLPTTDAQGREAVVVLQAAELPLHRTAIPVEVTEPLRVAVARGLRAPFVKPS
jgi:hypothetical protein